MNMCDLVIHVDETLEHTQQEELEDTLRDRHGVVSVHFSRSKHPHMITVAYNCDAMRSQDIVRQIETKGWHAQAVGM